MKFTPPTEEQAMKEQKRSLTFFCGDVRGRIGEYEFDFIDTKYPELSLQVFSLPHYLSLSSTPLLSTFLHSSLLAPLLGL